MRRKEMKRTKAIHGLVVLVGILIATFPTRMFGQTTTTGSITGSVRDQTGAFLPGVEIKGEQEGTGQAHQTISSETGTYTLPLLPPGKYTVTFRLPGFQTII